VLPAAAPIYDYFRAVQRIRDDVLGLVLVVVLLVVSLGVHESAHAWTALKCGDSTGRDLGRITLNPIAHVDPVLTILLPVITILTIGFPFGGAKPVPVDFHRLRRPWRDMSLVAAAGPLSNVLLAILFFALWQVLVKYGLYNGAAPTPFQREADRLPTILQVTVLLNALLAVFNMFPIPPLDGSRVMAWLLPASLRPPYIALERFGLFLVFGLMYLVPPVQVALYRGIETVLVAIEGLVGLVGLA
jgi:Zn-dependent protease